MATGDPIARGNIILGADTTPLEAGLSAAKEQAKAAGEEIQRAANGGDDSAAYQTRLQEMAAASEMERRSRQAVADEADRLSRAERNRIRETANANAASASAATTQASRWQRLRAAINGATVEVGGLNRSLAVIGQASGIIAIFTAATIGAYKLGEAIRERIVSALETGKDKADKLKESLDLSNVGDSIAQVTKELEVIDGKMAEFSEGTVYAERLYGRGDNPKKLREQRAELERLLISLNKTKKAQDDYNKSLAQQREYERQILQLQQQIQSANQASFGRIEASVEKIGQYVELMSRTIRRNG